MALSHENNRYGVQKVFSDSNSLPEGAKYTFLAKIVPDDNELLSCSKYAPSVAGGL